MTTPADLLLTDATVVDGDGRVEHAWVRFSDGVVADRGTGTPPAADGERIDAHGALLVPGFVDMHVHGGGRADASDGAGGVPAVLATHRAHGTAAQVLSLVSAPVAELASTLRDLAPLVHGDPRLLGVHLEGPFLSPDAKGAHDPSALTAPTPEAVEALLEAADGTIALVTIAPELPGALDAIGAFVDAGVRVAVGHTTADFDTALAAFDAGATVLTHTFNAMPGLAHRAPGPIGAALQRDGVTLELVADGLHVHPVLIGALFRLAPGRVALITDAMAAAGAGDGDYRLGALDVAVRDGAARLGSGSLAGSTLTLDRAVRTAVAAGVPVAEAVRAATATPARALGRDDLGTLAVGATAAAVLLDDRLEIVRTVSV